MENDSSDEFLDDEFIVFLYVQHEQFFDWLRKSFYLSDQLQNSYNRFYQELLYLHVNQLITEGESFINLVLSAKSVNSIDFKKYKEIQSSIFQIKQSFTQVELELIEYHRHCSCHIFQNKYEKYNFNNETIRKTRKEKQISELRNLFSERLAKKDEHSDSKFNAIFNSKINFIFRELINKLNH